jgi:hypothetical protein
MKYFWRMVEKSVRKALIRCKIGSECSERILPMKAKKKLSDKQIVEAIKSDLYSKNYPLSSQRIEQIAQAAAQGIDIEKWFSREEVIQLIDHEDFDEFLALVEKYRS